MFKDMSQAKKTVGKFLGAELSKDTKSIEAVNTGQYKKDGVSEETLEFLKNQLRETIIEVKKRYGSREKHLEIF